jgi:hypothetical protein
LKKHTQPTDLGLIDLRSRLDQQRLDESSRLLQVRVETSSFKSEKIRQARSIVVAPHYVFVQPSPAANAGN